MSSDAQARDRAKRLYQFVRELIMLRHVPIRSYRSYEQVVPLDDLPTTPDCSFVARHDFGEEEQDIWLEVRCPKLDSYPEPPAIISDWLDPSELSDATLDMPSLLSGSKIGVEDDPDNDEDAEYSASDRESPQEIKDAWEQYIEHHWWPWAERVRPKYRAKKLYDDLFRMYQRQEHLGETYELVVGFGLLSWRPADAVEVQRHLITVALSLELDSRRQILSLRPTASGIEVHLEEDMLDPTLRPPTDLRNRIKEQLREVDTALWDSDHLHGLLEEYGNALSPDAKFDRSYAPPKGISEAPVVTFAPSLILRKRGNEGLIGLVEAIIQSIEDGADIPPAVLQQVCIVDKHENRESGSGDNALSEDDEIYFPLPANREQRRIVEHLTYADGIVVEGPPGTGKSQTIANLICHLLATGKRVLVTSHTARALQVLRDKIPDPLKPLCVQALSNDAKGMDALEFSVKGITDRHLTWEREASSLEVERLDKDLAAARERLQKAIYDQRSIREAEVFRHEAIAGVYSGTLAEVARRLKSEEEQLGIIKDEVPTDHAPPCIVDEFRELVSILTTDPGHLPEMQADEPPDVSTVIHPSQFEELVNELANLEAAAMPTERSTQGELYQRLKSLPIETRRGLAAEIGSFAARMQTLLTQRREGWLDRAIGDIFSERDRSWRGRLNDSQEKLAALREIPREVLDAQVKGHEKYEPDALRHNAETLLRYLKSRKGKGIGLRLLLPRHIKTALDVLENVHIDGKPCINEGTLETLVHWTTAARLLNLLDKEWDSVEDVREDGFHRKMDTYEDVCEPLTELLNLFEVARTLSMKLRSECGDHGPTWRDYEDVQAYLDAFSCADASERLEGKKQEWKEHINLVGAKVRKHPGFSDFENLAIALAERDVGKYRRVHDTLYANWDRSKRRHTAAKILQTLSAVAPILAEELQECPVDPKWQLLAECWEAAWAWAITRTWLQGLVAPDADQRAAARVTEEQKRIQDFLAQLASAKAWDHCFDRLTEEQRQSLEAWALKVKQGGKFKGKYANQHRLAAREYLAKCQPAIPAWIMPMYRVAESIRPGKARFDVAIIDEASQSGPEALALLFLADQIVVVGDEKQISPDTFTRVEDVNRLRREFISDLPFNDTVDPAISLFAGAKIRYPARIRLVEHFRCMPEIIQFSNGLCYKAEPLIPLRQFGAGRLEPVVNVVHVPIGFTKGKTQKVNQPEATAVARKIAELLREKRYDGKTFGVISLLGDRHARCIETELLSLVDPKELNARSLICGDAYDFQGDERDVMFLSMVSAPGPDSRIGVLAKASDERRFNVAMSRAKDQVWLFHSATLNDLSRSDVRFQLLRYCQTPTPNPQPVVPIEDLAKQARIANRTVDKPPCPFESWFEVDVFLRIAAEGYLVIPQYEVNGYSIDLVVVGQKSKLAVECDGDHWHGAEQWERDAARQRDIERCDFPFFRIRESTFYLDPAGALEPLWDELKRHGIRPLGVSAGPEAEPSAPCPPGPETDGFTEEAAPPQGLFSEDDGFDGQDPTLPIYVEWEPSPVPDPRRASRESVIRALVEIAATEGPATWRRLFDRYRIGLCLGRLKGPTRKALEDAARHADETERLIVWAELGSGDWYDYVVHVPGSDRVRVRQRGPRNLEDVPASEIAQLIQLRDLSDADEEWMFRQILSSYGLRRLTERTKEHLRAAVRILQPEH